MVLPMSCLQKITCYKLSYPIGLSTWYHRRVIYGYSGATENTLGLYTLGSCAQERVIVMVSKHNGVIESM